MKGILGFIKNETVLCISAICAVVSMFIVPPSTAYAGYIDLRVLGLLWCLMAVVAGFRSCGLFEALTKQLLGLRRGGSRLLSVLLVLLPFFVSMAVTNDVALIAFVPFTLLLLHQAGCDKSVIPMVVLQTIAANLGSMATPVGNPQNLYLYARFNLSAGEFFAALLPLTAISLVCLLAAALPVLPRNMDRPELSLLPTAPKRLLWLYAGLFILCLLSVFRVLPWWALVILVAAALVIFDRKMLVAPDYCLLLTFVCFFVFSGNLGSIPALRELLRLLMNKSTLLTALLTSQVISNVPAAVLLSGFTENWQELLLGVDIGGLGTPVASLASLISLKFYMATENARPGKYLLVFTLANAVGLGILLLAQCILQTM